MLFFNLTFISTFFSISSSNWLGLWMGLEINMISFIPLIILPKNIFSNEAAIKYFLIQASSSTLFMASVLMNSFNSLSFSNFFTFNISIFIMIPMLIKMAAAPFHQWFIDVMSSMTWILCYLVSTLQKITPLVVLSYISLNTNFMMIFILISAFIGSVGGLNQIFIKKILAYSSVNHLAWLMSSLLLSKMLLMVYFIMYMMMNAFIMMILHMNNIYQLNQINNKLLFISFSLCMMSLAGLPPFIGFMPKLILIKALVLNGMMFTSFFLIMSALITLYYYLRISFTLITMNSISQKWIHNNYINFLNKNLVISLFIVMTSSTLIFLNFIV
nr:NADH dehydrogenase subunit 2 [Anomopsocus amabilis]